MCKLYATSIAYLPALSLSLSLSVSLSLSLSLSLSFSFSLFFSLSRSLSFSLSLARSLCTTHLAEKNVVLARCLRQSAVAVDIGKVKLATFAERLVYAVHHRALVW